MTRQSCRSWDVWCPSEDEDRDHSTVITAMSAEDAVLCWAKQEDDMTGKNDICEGRKDYILLVIELGADATETPPKRYRVTGSANPKYTAWLLCY